MFGVHFDLQSLLNLSCNQCESFEKQNRIANYMAGYTSIPNRLPEKSGSTVCQIKSHVNLRSTATAAGHLKAKFVERK